MNQLMSIAPLTLQLTLCFGNPQVSIKLLVMPSGKTIDARLSLMKRNKIKHLYMTKVAVYAYRTTVDKL